MRTANPDLHCDGYQVLVRLKSLLYLHTQKAYNVYMKERQIHIRVDEKFLEKLEYLKRLNGFRNLSETIRKIVEKEYRKEKEES